MSYLYVSEQGASIKAEGGYFVVVYKGGMIKKIPSETLEYIAVFGNVQLTTQAIKKCFQNGVVVNFFSSNGSYFGRLDSTKNCNISRQRNQFSVSRDVEFCRKISAKIILAKIHNQRVILERYIKTQTPELAEALKQIRNAENKIHGCMDLDQIKGYEGIAARYYFQALGKLILPDFRFEGRNRMPPKDPFNSMISLGYTLLLHEVYGAILGKGMSPYAAFLHQDKENHPTLASDMMEEWRAILIDSMVMSLIQGREVDIDGFYVDYETGAVLLREEVFKIFIRKYERKLRTETKYNACGSGRISYRRSIFNQIGKLAQAVDSEDPEKYEPIMIR